MEVRRKSKVHLEKAWIKGETDMFPNKMIQHYKEGNSLLNLIYKF